MALEVLPSPQRLIVRHEEQLVPPVEQLGNADRAIDLETEIVPLEGILGLVIGGERVRRCIQLVVAQELEQRAVILVAARLRQHVDLRGFMAELGRIDAGLHFELLQRVDGWQDDIGIEVRIGVETPSSVK